MSYLEDGIVTLDEIQVPDDDRLESGPVALIECVQEIPCNPCVDVCTQNAISMKTSINDVPVMNFELCNGCGICISNCPGLAIFLINKSKSTLGMPYEFLPLPEKGESVQLLDRSGSVCGTGEVVGIRNTRKQDRTPMITLAMDTDLLMTVRFFRRNTNDS